MTPRDPLPPINFAALADALLGYADTLIARWLPGGKMSGKNYMCGSVTGGSGNSFGIDPRTGKWGDFASGEMGNDLISLYAAHSGIGMGKAAVELAHEFGLESIANVQPARDGTDAPKREPRPAPPPASPKAEPEGWQTLIPVPTHAPAATFKHQHRPADAIEHTAAYRLDGKLLGYVVRFRTSDGGKETLPYTWCTSAKDGASRWHWKQWDEPRPLYIPAGTLPGARTVVLVEGEKKADVLQTLLEATAPGIYLVVSWAGGCKAWKKALWDWLKGCTVLLWPDCDAKREPLTAAERKEFVDDLARAVAQQAKPLLPAPKQPGMAAMLGIGALLQGSHACQVQLLPIPAPGLVPDGWDCADAINTDGWDADKVLAFFGRAQALPKAVDDTPAAAGGGGNGAKKPPRDDLAGAAPDDGESELIGGKRIPRWLAPYYDAKNKRWMTSRKMVITALEHDPLLAPVLGLNQLSNTIDARLEWPWPSGKAGPITGAIDLMLGNYFTNTYGLPSIPRAALMEAI